jgi:hypothetical protein
MQRCAHALRRLPPLNTLHQRLRPLASHAPTGPPAEGEREGEGEGERGRERGRERHATPRRRPRAPEHPRPGASGGLPQLTLRGTSSAVSVHEGGGCVSTAASAVRQLPRTTARRLRAEGKLGAARAVLDAARAGKSTNVSDLVELLLVMLDAGRASRGAGAGSRPRGTLHEMLAAVAESPAERNPTVCNVLLSACAWEAARTGRNAAGVKLGFVIGTAREIWREMLAGAAAGARWLGPDRLTVVLMYRVLGECRSLADVRRVRADADRLRLQESEGAVAAYLLCLGKCGRSVEAEQVYYSAACARFRGGSVVLGALFQAHVASDRISKAEALIVQHGADFLNVQTCNAFVHRCTLLRLRDKALDFVGRMRTSPSLPSPDDRTYNLLIKALCANAGAEDARVAADRALLVVEEMAAVGFAPSTVTYNTHFCQLADQGRLGAAMDL